MQLSVSRMGNFFAQSPKLWALNAVLSVSLLVALGTELSHAHENYELEYECEICMDKDTQILLFGGAALPEERFLMWNFVSHSKYRLKQAKEDWENKNFPEVPGDNTYIPIPSYKPKR